MPSITTIIASPQQLMPAYNPIKFIIDNTNVNEPGFRYIFTIYPAAGSHIPANVVAQYKVLPAFGTGYGEQDISMLMQSLVTFNFTTGQVNESWYQYDVDFGYEFISNIQYVASLQESAGGDVLISFNAHGFLAGDQVVITQTGTGPVDNPTVEGLHTVLFASANLFVINARWDTVIDDTANGTVAYADGRKTQVLDDEVFEDGEVFNGAYSSGIFTIGSAFPATSYYGVTGTQIALSSLTNNSASSASLVGSGDQEKFYLMCRVYSGVTYTLTYFDMSGNILAGPFSFTPTDGLFNFEISAYAHTITEDFFIEIEGNSGGVPFWNYYFKYDNRCTINDDTLIYLDRMGSWQTFGFQLKTYEKGQITREQYNQHIDGEFSSNEWVYSLAETGFRTYNTNVMYSLDLNTNWMDQYNANRFQELLTSPQVYYSPTNQNFDTYACTVEATAFENFRQRNKNLIKQSVTIRLAQQVSING